MRLAPAERPVTVLVARMGANESLRWLSNCRRKPPTQFASQRFRRACPDFIVPGAGRLLRFAIGYAIGERWRQCNLTARNANTWVASGKAGPFGWASRVSTPERGGGGQTRRMTHGRSPSLTSGSSTISSLRSTATGSEYVGAEALIRWNHPLFGNQPPGRFIEAAERTGLLLDLGERPRPRRSLCPPHQRAPRPAAAFSVNVSAIEFLHRDMADVIDPGPAADRYPAQLADAGDHREHVARQHPPCAEGIHPGCGISVLAFRWMISERATRASVCSGRSGDRDQDRSELCR